MSNSELYLTKAVIKNPGRTVTKLDLMSGLPKNISKSAEQDAFGNDEAIETQKISSSVAIYLKKTSDSFSKAKRRLDIGENAMSTTAGMRADAGSIDRLNPHFYAPNFGRMFSHVESPSRSRQNNGQGSSSETNALEGVANVFLGKLAQFAHPGSGERIWRPVVKETIDKNTGQKSVVTVLNRDGTPKRDLDYAQVTLELLSHMISGLTSGFHGHGFDMLANYRQSPRYESRVYDLPENKKVDKPKEPKPVDAWGRNLYDPIGYGSKENGWRPIYQKDENGKHVHVADAAWNSNNNSWDLDAATAQYGVASDIPTPTPVSDQNNDPDRERGRTRPIDTRQVSRRERRRPEAPGRRRNRGPISADNENILDRDRHPAQDWPGRSDARLQNARRRETLNPARWGAPLDQADLPTGRERL